jgi:hypothetical protein
MSLSYSVAKVLDVSTRTLFTLEKLDSDTETKKFCSVCGGGIQIGTKKLERNFSWKPFVKRMFRLNEYNR